ncbi:MAG: toprim domain-containing protein, partial [Acidimicrobiales bacterium]
MLEHVLARDTTPQSATTQQRLAADPRTQLADAAARYADALTVAATHVADPDLARHIARRLNHTLPGINNHDTWPTLLNQLLLIAADGHDPVDIAEEAINAGPLADAHDPAAVISARLEATSRTRGPLPWLPGIPDTLTHHPVWGPYLTARRNLVTTLTTAVRDHTHTTDTPPAWVQATTWTPPAGLIADIEVWRAATGVEPADLRPTGEPAHTRTLRHHQTRLNHQLRDDHNPALAEWAPLLTPLAPTMNTDTWLPQLARHLAHLSATGQPVRHLINQTITDHGTLPDDHPAAALWWRLTEHLDQGHTAAPTPVDWMPQLVDLLADHTPALQASPHWDALVDAIDRGLQRGWPLEQLLHQHETDPATDLLDHITRLADTHAPAPDEEPDNAPPEDLWDGHTPADPVHVYQPDVDDLLPDDEPADEPPPDPWDESYPPEDLDQPTAPHARTERQPVPAEIDDDDLTIEATIRAGLRVEPDPADLQRMLDQADQWHTSTVDQARLEHINELTASYYQAAHTHAWTRTYFTERFGIDVTGHPDLRPGYAPAGWNHLTQHLHNLGITDEEMLTAGVATRTRDGRLIDRFRDRAILPITHQGTVVGFVGRANPTTTDPRVPKYLNTGETPLFHKGNQLYGATHLLTEDPTRTPVIVEGPFDAHAITLATAGRYVGVAPLGTSLTTTQAHQLADLERDPVIATDPDLAGRLAAERDYWLLTPHNLDPTHAQLPPGADPADLLTDGRAHVLLDALTHAQP